MKIAYISYELPPDIAKGGIGTYTMQVASSMVSEGNEVHIFAGSNYRNETEKIALIYVHRILCTCPFDFTEKVSLKFSLVNSVVNFDIIECPEIHGNASLIKKMFPEIPLIVRLHAPNHLVESLKKTYTSLFEKARFTLGAWRRGNFTKGWGSYNKENDLDYIFTKIADVITAPSFAMKKWAEDHWNIKDDKIKVVSNPFLVPLQLSDIPITENLDYKTILFFGRLNVLKGLVNFTKAIRKFLKENEDWKVVVIGDDSAGPYSTKSMKQWMICYLGQIQNQVIFFDGMPQKELYEKIKLCEIVVLPSLFETFSYTCVEAMAAGKAVVGSNKGGMSDLIEENKSGILVNPYNYQEIYNAIIKVVNNNELRKQLSLSARNKICGNQYNQNIKIEMMNLYKEVLINDKNKHN